jgi:transcriptional regulator with XRE-family HTH domain
LIEHANSQYWAAMTDARKRPRGNRKRSKFVPHASELGAFLADLRTAKGFSLREVEEATDKAVSNAYLSQLENAVSYEALMEKAGYLLPSTDKGGRRRTRLAAFAIDDLTVEEEEELLKYLAFLRSRKPSS